MKYEPFEGSTSLIPGFEPQLRFEFVERFNIEYPCLIPIKRSQMVGETGVPGPDGGISSPPCSLACAALSAAKATMDLKVLGSQMARLARISSFKLT